MIPLSSYQMPRFTRVPEGATMSRNDKAVFNLVRYGGNNIRNNRIQPQTGYNPVYPRATPQKTKLDINELTLPPGAK
jgi:hypothetical protein